MCSRNANIAIDSGTAPRGHDVPELSWVALEFQTLDSLLNWVEDSKPVIGREYVWTDRLGDLGARF